MYYRRASGGEFVCIIEEQAVESLCIIEEQAVESLCVL